MQYNDPYIELCLEGSSSIFKGIIQKDKELLIEQHSVSVFSKGRYLFREGDKARGLLCLASGKVKVFKEGVGGRSQILKMVKQQGLIGYRNLFVDQTWTFSATALEESAICIFDKVLINKLLKKYPDMAIKLMKSISDELSFANNRLVSLTQKHIRGRLAESIVILRDTYGFEADGRTLRVLMSREDMANLSNMTTSNAIRTLSTLENDRIIEIAGRRISIIDNAHLEQICELG